MSKAMKEWKRYFVDDIERKKQSGWFYHTYLENSINYYMYYKGEHIWLNEVGKNYELLESSIAL